MKMAFELNDLKGFLFLVLITIPSTSSTNYDCKGKSFYCLDSTHFLICVDFGSGVLSTIDDFALPCPFLTECHESNTYECELPKVETTTLVYTTSVTEKSDNSIYVVPLIKTAPTVSPELTSVLPSTEKSTAVPASEVVTSESNKEVLESLKDQFTGGNKHFFEPTKFIKTDNIVSANVESVNKTGTLVKDNNFTANAETSSDNIVKNSIKDVPGIIDLITSFKGLLVTDSTTKSRNITYNNIDNIGINITANKSTKSNNSTSDTEKLPNLPLILTNYDLKVIRSDVTSPTNTVTTVPLEATSVLPSTETNTVTTVPFDVTTLQPSLETNTIPPALELPTFASNKAILEKIKEEFTGANEKIFEHTPFVPPSTINLSPSVDKVNKISTTVDKILNPKPGIDNIAENTMEITVTEYSKNIDVTTPTQGLPIPEFKESNIMSLNITRNSTNIEISNVTTNELTKLNKLTGDEVLDKSLPTSSLNLNSSGVISLSETSNNNIVYPINTETTVPLKTTTVPPSTEKNTVKPMLKAVTSKSNKEILESLRDEFAVGNEKMFEPTKFKRTPIMSSNPIANKVNDMSAMVDIKSNPKSDVETSTENITKIVLTDGLKNKEVITSIDGLQATDLKSANFIPISPNIHNNKLNITVDEHTKSEILTSYEAEVKISPISSSNLNTHGVNINKTSYNDIVPIKLTTVQPSTDENTFTPVVEVTSKLNKDILESLRDEFTGGNEKIFKPTTFVLPHSVSSNISIKKTNEMSISTERNINIIESIETSTESTEKSSVTNDSKTKYVGTIIEEIVIKNVSHASTLQNMSHTTINTRDVNITDNLSIDKAPNNFTTLSSNISSGHKYDLDNYYSQQNLKIPIIVNGMTLDPIVSTEINKTLNANIITDNVRKNLLPEEQKDFLSNQSVQLEKSTTTNPLEVSSTVKTSNHLKMEVPNVTEAFKGLSDARNNASVSKNKYETIKMIDVEHTTFSTMANVVENPAEQNLDVLNNNEKNGAKYLNITTLSNNEPSTEVILSTTPITNPEIISTTASSKTIEKSISPLVDSVTVPNIYENKNEPNALKIGETKKGPIDIKMKSTLSLENSIDLTPLSQLVVTASIYSDLYNGKESSPKKQINATPPSKTDEIKSVDVNNLVVTTTENLNPLIFLPSYINDSENNNDLFKPNVSSLTIKKLYGPKDVNNTTLNNKVLYPTVLERTITVSSTTEPSAVIKDQIKSESDLNSVPITPTLLSTYKSDVVTEVTYTPSITIDNKPTKTPSILESGTKSIPEGVTLTHNINTNDTNFNSPKIKKDAPTVIYRQHTSPESISEYIKEHKVEPVDIFSTTVKPITKEPLTSENIVNVTTLTSLTSQVTENPLHSAKDVTKSDYAEIIAKPNIPYPNKVILAGYRKPDYSTSTSNEETTTSGTSTSSETLINNKITGTNVKNAALENYSTMKPVTVPISREILHSEAIAQLPLEVTTFVPTVTGYTAKQMPKIVADKIPLATMAQTDKPYIVKSSKISTVQTSNSIAINDNEHNISTMELITVTEKNNTQKQKPSLGGAVNNDSTSNSTYSTNLKITDGNNTTIREAMQINIKNTTFVNKTLDSNSNKEDMNLETTANALEKALLHVDIGDKSKNENDNEDKETTRPYGSASRIELTTPSTLLNKKPVINTSYVTPQSGKSQIYNVNISNTQTNPKDNKTKTIPAETKIPMAAIHGSEVKVNSRPTFDCRNKTRGKYGDSKDCQKFYTCIGTLQPIVGICPNHTVFSEINKQCTRNLSHCVRNNQFHCLYEGRFSDFFKDNVYYICVKNKFHGFLRYTLQCQSGYYLNKAIVKCEKIYEYKESVSSISESSKISNDQDKSTTKSDESEKSVNSDFECKKEGLFPYSNDCRMYYVCSKNNKDEYRRMIKKCSSDEFYDKEKKKCVYSDSIEC